MAAERKIPLPEEKLLELLESMHVKRELMTNAEWYWITKHFYKMPKSNCKYTYDQRLEEKIVKRGILVTMPCYKALSGERPNNIDDYERWVSDKSNSVSIHKLLKALPEAYKNKVDQILGTGKSKKGGGKVAAVDEHERTVMGHTAMTDYKWENIHTPVTMKNGDKRLTADQIIMNDVDAGPFLRLCAAVRQSLRELGRADDDAQNIAAIRAVAWYEQFGPATGHSPSEHNDRIERAIRIAHYFAQSFDPSKVKMSTDLWIDEEMIQETMKRQSGVISNKDIKLASHGRKLPTRRQIATVSLILWKNIITNRGMVPQRSITAMLRELGHSMNNSMLSTAMNVLLLSRQYRYVKGYYHCPYSGKGRCTQYSIRKESIIPESFKPYIDVELIDGVAKGEPSKSNTLANRFAEHNFKKCQSIDNKIDQLVGIGHIQYWVQPRR